MRKIVLLAVALFAILNAASGDVFKVKTVTGKELEFIGTKNGVITKPYEGKIVFIEFWGTWCGPCLMSIPEHAALQKKYKNNLRIIAFETTPSTTKEQLIKFVNNPKDNIDMSKIEWFMQHKARSPQAKAYFKKPIEELLKFKNSGEKIPYDVVDSKEGRDFVSYIAHRAGWRGSIPFLMVFDQKGNVVDIISGMPTKERLEKDINVLLKRAKESSNNSNNKENNTTRTEKNSTKK